MPQTLLEFIPQLGFIIAWLWNSVSSRDVICGEADIFCAEFFSVHHHGETGPRARQFFCEFRAQTFMLSDDAVSVVGEEWTVRENYARGRFQSFSGVSGN